MNKIVIVKPFTNRFIAHVYEHMYAFQIVRFFRDKKLLPYLDYTVDAKNYHKGFIFIEVCLFSEESLKLAGSVSQIQLVINEESINKALLQIMAEKSITVTGVEYPLLAKALSVLDATQWIASTTAAIAVTNTPSTTLKYVDTKKTSKLSYIEQKLSISKSNHTAMRGIHSLAVVLANIIQATLQEDVCIDVPCYSIDDFIIEEDSNVVLVNKYSFVKQYVENIDGLYDSYASIIDTLKSRDVVSRLKKIALQNNGIVPAAHQALGYFGEFIGAEYWEKHVKTDIIRAALELISVEFRVTRK